MKVFPAAILSLVLGLYRGKHRGAGSVVQHIGRKVEDATNYSPVGFFRIGSFSQSSTATTVRANDACNDATVATTLPFSTLDNMAGATSDFTVTTCSVPPTQVGRWYEFQGGDKIVEVSITASSINTRLTLFQGSGCSTQICVTSKDDGGGNNNFLSFAALSGQTYRLLVTGVSASEGTYNIEIKELARPANDDCASALKLPTVPSSVGGDSSGSFSDFQATTCSVPPVSRGVWYNFTGKLPSKVSVRDHLGRQVCILR